MFFEQGIFLGVSLTLLIQGAIRLGIRKVDFPKNEKRKIVLLIAGGVASAAIAACLPH
jgi:Na+-translocating ferredoxin:NAD+ oxidoreductase RnfA subunit